MIAELLDHHIMDHTLAMLKVAGFSLPVTKHLLMMWIACGLLALGMPVIVRLKSPSLLKSAVEAVVVFLRDDVVLTCMGPEGLRLTPYFCTLFFFVLFCNLLGLVPFGSAATGNIAVTAALALTSFALINISGVREHGLFGYLGSLVPSGVPWWLYPLLFVIEIIGLIAKTLALCIRLFANMIAGHIVLIVMMGLIFVFATINIYATLFITIPMEIPMSLFVTLLEVFIGFLQAYIFTFLTAIFTGAAMHSH